MLTLFSVAPFLATQALHTLRNLNFISARLGSNAFSQYNFVYLSSIDILSAYAPEAEAFIKEIQPGNLGHIPRHPVDRCLDLFFLNTAEHFTMVLSSRTNEGLLTAAASPYLAHGGNNNLLDIFEAAHSVMLAVFSAPQNAAIAAKQLPFYVDALFKVNRHLLRAFKLNRFANFSFTRSSQKICHLDSFVLHLGHSSVSRHRHHYWHILSRFSRQYFCSCSTTAQLTRQHPSDK